MFSAGYQKVVRIVVESATQVCLQYNMQALEDQLLQGQAAWKAVVGIVSVQWSS